ncbi:MAG: response regulator [Verrucomicrobiota bacterium]
MTQPAKILIVDDNEIMRLAATRVLGPAGFDLLEAATGAEALRLAREHLPNLMLLDVHLPDLDGLEVCRQIKSDPLLARIFIVQLSSVRTASDQQAEGLDSGADGYIARPIGNAELLARVQSMLRIQRTEFALRESEKKYRQLATELQQALDEVSTLRGLIPICSACKKIRDDQGYWNQIEQYIQRHTGAKFTHGICPDCIKKYFPGI